MKNTTLLWILCGTAVIVLYGLFDPTLYRFPPCPMRSLTGWLCPGCGSQRAIHHALQGNFVSSFNLNPLFLPAVAYALIAFVIRIFFPKKWPVIKSKFYGLKAAYIALGVIIIFWVGRNVF